MRFVLTVPIKPISWNTLARQNHWKFSKVFHGLKDVAKLALLETWADKPKFTKPVTVRVNAHWKGGRRHDVDNVVVKPLLDLLVEERILEDDDSRCVRSVTLTGETGCDKDEYVIEIEEVEDGQDLSRLSGTKQDSRHLRRRP